MKRSTITALRSFTMAIAVAVSLIGPTVAEEVTGTNFRVDSGIFKMGETKPALRTVTVFSDGKVYDFMFNSKEIVIFNELNGSFTLINVPEGVQTVITKPFVDKAIERLTQLAANKSDPKTKFLYNPKFAPIQKDAVTGELIFKSPLLTYRVTAKPGDFKAAKQYYRFADAYAKLNTIINPGSKPPFARMLVNQTLAAGTMLPKTILITNGEETDPKASRFRSEHRYEMNLGKTDQKRINKVKESLETLTVVPIEKYIKLLYCSGQKI